MQQPPPSETPTILEILPADQHSPIWPHNCPRYVDGLSLKKIKKRTLLTNWINNGNCSCQYKFAVKKSCYYFLLFFAEQRQSKWRFGIITKNLTEKMFCNIFFHRSLYLFTLLQTSRVDAAINLHQPAAARDEIFFLLAAVGWWLGRPKSRVSRTVERPPLSFTSSPLLNPGFR